MFHSCLKPTYIFPFITIKPNLLCSSENKPWAHMKWKSFKKFVNVAQYLCLAVSRGGVLMSLFFEIQGCGRHTSCRLSAAIDPLIIQILQPNPVCPAPVTCNDSLMSHISCQLVLHTSIFTKQNKRCCKHNHRDSSFKKIVHDYICILIPES